MATDTTPGVVARTGSRPLPWYAFGIANLVAVSVLSLLSWYLLVDPDISPLSVYPEPYQVVLFWAILSVVFVGFNLEFHGFEEMPQPARGLALIATTVGLAGLFTVLLTVGLGQLDPSFATGREDSLGYVNAQLYVLIGFFTYLTLVVNFDHWPYRDLGLKQPWLGITEILAATGVTILLYHVLVAPNAATWATKEGGVIDLPTTIGWFYSVIVATLITGLTTDNWPYRLAGPRGAVAAASLVGNFVLGTVLYFVLGAVVKAVVGSSVVDELGPAINQYPAEIGVCWGFWMILWANAFANKPDGLSHAANMATRIAVTFVLGLATFVLYYYVLAGTVLHEPAVAGSLHGDALGWMDWMVLWILFYVVCLGSSGLPPQPEPAADADELPTA